MSDDSQPNNWLAVPPPDPAPVEPPPLPSTPAEPPPTPKPPFSLLALFALIGGLIVLALACVGSLMLIVLANNNPSLPMLISLVLAVGIPGGPLAWFAWRRLQGQTTVWQGQLWSMMAGLVGLVIIIGLGQVLIGFNLVPSLIASIVQPLVFGIAAIVALTLAAGGWQGLSQLRVWSHFVGGAWVAVAFSMVAEIVTVGGLAIVVLLIWASVAPEQVQPLIQAFRSNPEQIDPQVVAGLLRQPWVMALAYLVASIMIPLIEELAKSFGVIALVGQRPTPMNAFLGGLLGGLGFGFTESLSNLINLQDPWFVLVVARLGTLAMHGFASSLVGWGWGQFASGRPGRLALAYLGAVSVHGLWNGAVVTFVFVSLFIVDKPPTEPLTMIGVGLLILVCALILLTLVPLCIGGVIGFGYWLRSRAAS